MILYTPINTDDHELKLRLKNIISMSNLEINFIDIGGGTSKVEIAGGLLIEREQCRLLLELAITTYYIIKGTPE